MASSFYNSFKTSLMKGTFDFNGSHTIKIALMKDTYGFSASHVNWGDTGVSENEIDEGGGYLTGGATIDSSVDGTATAYFNTSDDITWGTSTITASSAIIYDSTAPDSPLIAWLDFGGSQSSSSGDFTISWSSTIPANVIVSLA